MRNDPFGCVAVPEFGDGAFFPVPGEEFFQGGFDGCGIGADQLVGADFYGLGPLGVVAQRDAGDPHDGGLFGDAAGVGDDGPGALYQIVEFQIA